MSDLFDVSGKTALVTGGSRGIGLMIARGLVQAGARATAAIDNDRGVTVRHRRRDLVGQVAARDEDRAGDVPGVPLDLLAHVDEGRSVRLRRSGGVDIDLAHDRHHEAPSDLGDGSGTYLATTDPRNLPFYERSGFAAVGGVDLGGPYLTVLQG